MKLSNKIVAGFMVVQFLNVQIQSAFGTEATRSMSAEYQQVRQTLVNHISKKISTWSEERQTRFAEKLTQLGVQARNKTAQMSEKKFNRRLAKRLDHFSKNANTSSIANSEVKMDNTLVADLNDATSGLTEAPTVSTPAQTQAHITQAQFLSEIDPVLMNAGATIDENNHMSAPTELKQLSAKLSSHDFIDALVSLILAIALLMVLIVVVSFFVAAFYYVIGWVIFIGFCICVGSVGVRIGHRY